MMAEPSQDHIWSYFQNEAPQVFGGSHSHPRLEFIVRTIGRLRGTSTPTLLNIGIGDGHLEKTAQRLAWSVHSLDPDSAAVSALSAAGITATAGRIEEIPYSDGQFDFVVASEVLEHLTEAQRRQGLGEIQRVLKSGGYFIGTVPYAEILEDNIAACPQCRHVFHRWGHTTSFDLRKLRAELSPRFRVIACRKTAFVQFRGRTLSGKIKSLVRLVLAKCGARVAVPNIFFIAAKA